MRVTDVWGSGKAPTISCELFPARSPKGEASLETAIDELAALNPTFASVTFGAGGSTREGSRQLVEKLCKDKGLDVVAYFAGFGLGPDQICDVLDTYKSLGVENVLVVRGDPPKDDGFTPHPEGALHATELVDFVVSRYQFCLGVAGYPEGHIEAESKEKDLEYLKMKVDKGAQYIITNYFYDNQYYYDFVDRSRAAGITVPIVPGVMPIYSAKMLDMLAGLCGATITEEIRTGMAALPVDDKDALIDFGVEFALQKCRDLLAHDVPGLHFYTMDKSTSTVRIVTKLREEGAL
jgi:methylenetetrahydrofolate reductase (NADPH)